MVFLGPADVVHVLQSLYIILNMGMFRVVGFIGSKVLSAMRRRQCGMVRIHIIVFPK